MPKFIVHHEGFFFEWSTVVDAPTTYGMKRDEFEEYYRDQYGAEGMKDLPARMDRATSNGTSAAYRPMTARELISVNRAGPGETDIPFEEVIRIYCHERPDLLSREAPFMGES